jgi:hypothetical protein
LAVGQLGVGVALGRFDCRPALWQVGQPSRLLFQFSQHLLIDFKRSASKIQNMNFPMPKNFQNLPGGRKFPKGTFWEKVQITNGLWIQNPSNKTILNLIWILKGVQTFEKKSINSPKLFLDMIFNSVNLNCLTYIKKFKVPLQVANRT